jgi:hypothetical protein
MIAKRSLIAILLLFLLLPGSIAIVQSQDNAEKESPCCFTNTSYQGTCVVTPAEDETCDSILQYLNTPGAAGKSYCQTSRIRGGWQKAECPAPE